MVSQSLITYTNSLSQIYIRSTKLWFSNQGQCNNGIYLVKHSLTNKTYIKKTYPHKYILNKCIRTEIQLLKKLNYPNIIKYIDSYLDTRKSWTFATCSIDLEYCFGGLLLTTIQNQFISKIIFKNHKFSKYF